MTPTKRNGRGTVWMALVVIVFAVRFGTLSADEVAPAVKARLLGWINDARAAHGLPPVAFDLHTSNAADTYCREQLRERTTGHFSRSGIPPYARYSAAGVIDGLSENAASWSAAYRFDPNEIEDLVWTSHVSMLDEKPPDDGHRKALLDPSATHVGIGLAWEGGEMRLVEVFLRRYLQWSHAFPSVAGSFDRPWASATPRHGFKIDQISVYWEPHPRALSAEEANSIHSYGLPSRYRDYRPIPLLRSQDARPIPSTARATSRAVGSFTLQRDGSFEFIVPFDDGPGIYTVVVWVRGDDDPGLIAASNASIRVGTPAAARPAAGGR